MRILFDENVPHPLAGHFRGHQVETVQGCGWRGFSNGELLGLAEVRFDVFVVADKNLRYQQNLAGRLIAIVELPTNRWPLLQPIIPQIIQVLGSVQPGSYTVVGFQ